MAEKSFITALVIWSSSGTSAISSWGNTHHLLPELQEGKKTKEDQEQTIKIFSPLCLSYFFITDLYSLS